MEFLTLQAIETFFITQTHKKRDYPQFLMLKKAMEILGHPEENLQYIHVTGTNGKGSTSHYISGFLQAHGLNVGLFTSPHIFSMTERLKYNNEPVSEELFLKLFNETYQKLTQAECKLVQFEWLFVLALVYFQTVPVDVVVLEVGIGGLYDTTNIIPNKLAAVITNVEFDHQGLLGETIVAIAEQKAGIITKATAATFLGKMSQEPKRIMVTTSNHNQVPVYQWQHDFNYQQDKAMFVVFDYQISNKWDYLPMFQYENISLALAVAIKVLTGAFFKKVEVGLLETVIETLYLPIRFEVLKRDKKHHIFDGAHNVAGIETMLKTLSEFFPNRKYCFIFCAMADKEYEKMLELLQTAGEVYIFDYHQVYNRALTIDTVATLPIIENEKALLDFVATTEEDILVYVGSIYYVSYVRALFE